LTIFFGAGAVQREGAGRSENVSTVARIHQKQGGSETLLTCNNLRPCQYIWSSVAKLPILAQHKNSSSEGRLRPSHFNFGL